MLKQVISLQWPQWIRMKSTSTRGGRVKQLRILTVLDVWVENESQGTKTEEPPSLKGFRFLHPSPHPQCKKTKTPLKIT